ncbi:MAG: hypothetical protein AB7V13_27960 [Pseudorhodoplanes sp.]
MTMHAVPKRTLIRDSNWLAEQRTQPCIVCGKRGATEAAHISLGSHKGTAEKAGDDSVIPLCTDCHRYQHAIGEPAFWMRAFANSRLLGEVLQGWANHRYARGR